jgi:inorganic phosphate transporter, PiT family
LFSVEIGLVVLFLLGFGNGANDVGKSIVALMTDPESATFQPRYKPLIWGGVFSGIGSIAAILISVRLFSAFTPQSFLLTTPGSSFIISALVGASVWILIATLIRVQVSTTHAIVGAIIIQAVYLLGTASLQWSFVVWRILLPLAAGPFAALLGVYILSRLSRRRAVEAEQAESKHYGIADWGSAAGVAFARGINDAPKMAALGAFLLLGTPEDTVWLPYVVVGVAVVAGSLVWGDRVAKTLIGHIPQHRGHRLKAHAATAVLVSAGAYFGDAFSTTHVSDGAAAGHHGKKGRQFLGSALRGMATAWIVTLPMAGLFAIAASVLGAGLWG